MDADQIKQLHAIELEITQIFEEKRAIERQKVECEAAIQELTSAPAAYKIIGSIMIAAKPTDLLAQTKQKLEMHDTQLRNLSSREKELTAEHKKFTKA